ncbi:WD repeat-containing protein 37 [Orchesella cincta]|uniref:WD repeat-containing protein 37 n=1 Tax=Orchesella cincta TaxID=48709 RepID=A0A1D2MJF1_ORCCI|nr:WD repeat-containing protein 37 [Orchesella cincta]
MTQKLNMSYKKSSRKRSSLKKGESVLPIVFQSRLNDLFTQIEKEFEALYVENLALHEKLENLASLAVASEQPTSLTSERSFTGAGASLDCTDGLLGEASGGIPKGHHGKVKGDKGLPGQQKVALRLKQQTHKIVSSFKTNPVSCSFVKEFSGHKDGIWDVTSARLGIPVVGTASADHKAGVWSTDSGRCLLRYQGHNGSVNSIRFHPTRELALTASGDHTAHIWQAAVAWEQMIQKGLSSEEEYEASEKEEVDVDSGDGPVGLATLRTPSSILNGHTSVVICADWLCGGDQLITASWDRSACLWDTNTGERIQNFYGHDAELSFVSTHPVQKFVVTTSKDATFRTWDLRMNSHSVSVFQGHTDNITSAVFTKEEKLVSGSDDRTVKVWDIRNMRASLVTIRLDSAVNRISVSSNGLIAIPHDDRHVRIFDLSGQRLGRLPRSNRQGHRRMATSCTWGEDQKVNLFTCGFDRVVMAWNVQYNKDKEKDKDRDKERDKD